VNFIENTILRK